MLVNVTLKAPGDQEGLVVPQEAVIATGKRSVVVVREDDGRFRPVDVVVGRAIDSNVEITKGLSEGQTVVTSGQFLLDSEANMKSALPRIDATSQAPESNVGNYHGTAKVESIDKDEVMLSHGPIPALKWPPMTMGFKNPQHGLPPRLKVGDDVEFDFVKTQEGDYALTRIAPIAKGGGRP